ncbi:AT-rich interactive domain-containing protein 6-like isoform X2 [Magnolia sinica]|uniref:AT-rich interactive domain-containing protein 6-like isoform X2 n=1 Tax=Magnolia sinica TaxID=86752 RepID=UPI002657B4DC|nr:AT-rich interactive domain-containing protein 6-like isoform X2 [Magnolia sinica]
MEMSGGKDNEELGQDFMESSDKELFDADIKEEEFDPVESGESDGKSGGLSTGAHFSSNPDFAEANSVKQTREAVESKDDDDEEEEDDDDDDDNDDDDDMEPADFLENAGHCDGLLDVKTEKEIGVNGTAVVQSEEACFAGGSSKQEAAVGAEHTVSIEGTNQSFPSDPQVIEGYESGTEEEQMTFMKELATFFRDRGLEFKPPKFYGEGLNCLKLWRAVTRLGGYDTVTSCKLWRQVGESFKPPKTCTTVSWSFRCFYEKALLDYERYKMRGGELHVPVASPTGPMAAENQVGGNQASGSGRARRDAAARAMQGWHSQRLLGNGEDKNSVSLSKREKQLKSLGVLKRKKPSSLERAMNVVKAARTKAAKPQMDTMIVDIGPSADWVKINVRRTKDCFEIYALVPGLLREEVRVQSDPAGRLVISGNPEQPDNPWGVTPFKKVISLPSRIDPHQTSAVVTLHGQLFVRAPFEQSDL